MQENGKRRNGIPEWETVENWIDPGKKATYPEEEKKSEIKIENECIPQLERYDVDPGEEFWKLFPKKDLPKRPETRINTKNLAKELERGKGNMSKTEYKRAKKLLADLTSGADAYQKDPPLPPLKVQNSASAVENGPLLTDKIVTWV